MLHLQAVTIAFGAHVLFSNLDLSVGRGQLVGITGESGCGKTSLLRAVLGFVPLTSGTIEVAGLPLDVDHIHEIRRLTAYIPQELQPLAETGRDLINLTHDLEANRPHSRTPESAHSRIPFDVASTAAVSGESSSGTPTSDPTNPSSILSELGLAPSLLEFFATKLSGGQRQRVLIASALALPKPLILLDEPSSALDEDSTRRVGETLIYACHEDNRSALVVSHDPILLSFCDQIITL